MSERSVLELDEDVFSSVIHPGILLAISLYHFASPLGSAGEDMRDLGAEITLFCAIMRQVRSIFERSKSFRVSTTAIQDVHDVLARGKAIFEKIEALLSRLQSEEDVSLDVFTRVGQTFRKTKVLMWKESLRSCTAMLHVMLTTMEFAESIASSEMSTPTSRTGNDQLRDLMQSLLLAQQSTNSRLRKLEDQALLDEMQPSMTSGTPSPHFLGPDDTGRRAGSRSRHHRNRSSKIIHEIAKSEVAELLSGGSQRTSVLLNNKIPLETIPESQRNTWSSRHEYRQSIAYSTDLLQNWTDQIDPSPPYALSLHIDYAANIPELVALRNLRQTNNPEDKSTTENSSSMELRQLVEAQEGIDTVEKPDLTTINALGILNLPSRPAPLNLVKEERSEFEDKATVNDGQESSLEAGQALGSEEVAAMSTGRDGVTSHKVWIIFALRLHLVDISQCATSAEIYTAIVSNVVPKDVRFLKSYTPWVLNGNEMKPESFAQLTKKDVDSAGNVIVLKAGYEMPSKWETEKALSLGSREDSAIKPPQETVPGLPESHEAPVGIKTSPNFSGTSKSPASSSATIGDFPEPSLGPNWEASSTKKSDPVFKKFSVSLEDPCYKVLPAALLKYNIIGDWRTYALYVVYGDQERCIGLEEKPLAIFKELDREGKKPMFMLRKLAGAIVPFLPDGSGISPVPGGVI